MNEEILEIRSASLDDASTLVDLTKQLGYAMDESTVVDNVKAYLEDADRLLLVAVFRLKVIGYIALDITQTFHRKEKQMRVISLVIDQGYRGNGVGKLLLERAETWAKKNGCWVVEITSSIKREKEGTHAFYINQNYLKGGNQAYFYKTF